MAAVLTSRGLRLDRTRQDRTRSLRTVCGDSSQTDLCSDVRMESFGALIGPDRTGGTPQGHCMAAAVILPSMVMSYGNPTGQDRTGQVDDRIG